MPHLLMTLDRTLNRIGSATAWLVLPMSLLLFLQWPLRDLVRGWSREANDLAQWVFALYIAAAVTAATGRDAHPRVTRRTGRAFRVAEPLCVLPWSLFVLIQAAGPVWRSVLGLEQFPDTFNPGYFLVKLAAWLMVLLIAARATLSLAAELTGAGDRADAVETGI